MESKDRKPTASEKSPQQLHAEKRAMKNFFTDLQKAIDGVDWGKVKVPSKGLQRGAATLASNTMRDRPAGQRNKDKRQAILIIHACG
jgi:hypothetical protein